MRSWHLWKSLWVLPLLAACGGGSTTLDMALEVDPSTVTLPAVAIGDTVDRVIQLRHIGTEGTIRLESFQWTGDTLGEFRHDPPPVTELAPGQQTSLAIHYTPQDPNPKDVRLVITHNVAPDYRSEVLVVALGQSSTLRTIPGDIDFGEVQRGEHKDLQVQILNDGSAAITIRKEPYLQGSEDFTIEGAVTTPGDQAFPFDMKPREALTLTLRYTPTNGGADEGLLLVDTLFQGSFEVMRFPIRGREVGPRLVLMPGELDFGVVPLGETRTLLVTVDNDGSSEAPADSLLTIPSGGIALSDSSDTTLSLVEEGMSPARAIPAQPWSLKAEAYPGYPDYQDVPESRSFRIQWVADNPKADDGLPIGNLLVTSNDKGTGLLILNIFGRVAVPMLDVFPSPMDFGYVAQGIEARQALTIRNSGNGPLRFTAPMQITDDANGEFSITPDASLAATRPDYDADTDCPEGPDMPPACAIGPGETRTVLLRFKNLGGTPNTMAQAKLQIASNAFQKPVTEVDLLATRASAPTCVPLLNPGNLNFGTVIQGESATRTVYLINNGTGYCSFQNCTLNDCPTLASFINVCQKSLQTSRNFRFTSPLPPAVKDGMGPGFKHPIQIQFDSPKGEFWATNLYGLLRCEVHDGYQSKTVEVPTKMTGGFGDGYPVNLVATLGYVNIIVTPKVIDFGLQYLGCGTLPRKVHILNTGNAPLTLKKVSFSGCSPQMRAVTGLPAADTLINPRMSLDVELNFVPQQAGEETCYLKIESNDLDEPVVYVKLHGEGTADRNIRERFRQVSGQDFDVLFVQDDCACTVMDYGANILEQVRNFSQSGAIWNRNFHVGVVIALIDDIKMRGRLCEGNPAILPRYVHPGLQDPSGKFYNAYDQVMEKASSDTLTKGGLLAGYLAVTEPLTTNTQIPCTTTGECQGDPNLCPDPATCELECIEGFCGGYNWGFYRDDAYLDIVFISKADDGSPGTLNEYRDYYQDIKGPLNRDLIRLHSVTWIDRCEGHAGHGPGDRYIAMSREFGGKQEIICDSFAPMLNQIASTQGALKRQFFLAGLPRPETIQVTVNGRSCATGWSYDNVGNSIVFDPSGPCMPQYSQDIEVTYEAFCQ